MTPTPKESSRPDAWIILASNTGRPCSVSMDAEYVSELKKKWLIPLYSAEHPMVKGLVDFARNALANLGEECDPQRTIAQGHAALAAFDAAKGEK